MHDALITPARTVFDAELIVQVGMAVPALTIRSATLHEQWPS